MKKFSPTGTLEYARGSSCCAWRGPAASAASAALLRNGAERVRRLQQGGWTSELSEPTAVNLDDFVPCIDARKAGVDGDPHPGVAARHDDAVRLQRELVGEERKRVRVFRLGRRADEEQPVARERVGLARLQRGHRFVARLEGLHGGVELAALELRVDRALV